jgi:predicted MFS family arabinose efflux permease
MFLVSGAAIGTWTARIPSAKQHLHLSDGRLSVALLALAVGGLAGMRFSGRVVDRYGSATVMTPAALLLGPALIVPAYANNLAWLVAALLFFGLIHGWLNTCMNVAAVQLQRAYRRPITTLFHALFSMGGMAGAAVGAVLAHAGHGIVMNFVLVGMAILGLGAWAVHINRVGQSREPDSENSPATVDPTTQHGKRRGLLGLRAGLLGALAFCALINEGASADWSGVYLNETLGSSAAMAAGAYAAFSLMMTIGRLIGDRLVRLAGPVHLLRACGTLAASGIGIAVFIGQPLVAVVGFAALGAGLSCIVPQLYAAAANLDPSNAGRGISTVAAIGYIGYLTGPALIGALADRVGLAQALTILPLLAITVVAGAGVVRAPLLTPARAALSQ